MPKRSSGLNPAHLSVIWILKFNSTQGLALPHPTGEVGISQTHCEPPGPSTAPPSPHSHPSQIPAPQQRSQWRAEPCVPQEKPSPTPHLPVLAYPAALHKTLPLASLWVLQPPAPSSNNQYWFYCLCYYPGLKIYFPALQRVQTDGLQHEPFFSSSPGSLSCPIDEPGRSFQIGK